MTDPDDLRGDPSNPVVQLQKELGDVLERYPEVRKAKPGWVAALLVEYADSYRQADGVDVDVGRVADDVFVAKFNESTAWIGAPRSGEYLDVDFEALDELVDADVEDTGITTEEVELVDPEDMWGDS